MKLHEKHCPALIAFSDHRIYYNAMGYRFKRSMMSYIGAGLKRVDFSTGDMSTFSEDDLQSLQRRGLVKS